MKYYLSISAVTIYLLEPVFCELNGQQVVRIRISFSEFNADSAFILIIAILQTLLKELHP